MFHGKYRPAKARISLGPLLGDPFLTFGAFCLDVRALTFYQLIGFSIEPLKVKLLAGEQKATV